MTIRNTATAMGIALLLLPGALNARPWDPHQEMLQDCFRAELAQHDDSASHQRVYDAAIDNSCDDSVRFDGVAELWVGDRLVETARLDERGRARLRHVQPRMIAYQSACVIVTAEQVQSCAHRNSDAPGHAHHEHRFPIGEMRCGFYE